MNFQALKLKNREGKSIVSEAKPKQESDIAVSSKRDSRVKVKVKKNPIMFGQQKTRQFMLTTLLNELVQIMPGVPEDGTALDFFLLLFPLKTFSQKLLKKPTGMLNTAFEQSRTKAGLRQHRKK